LADVRVGAGAALRYSSGSLPPFFYSTALQDWFYTVIVGRNKEFFALIMFASSSVVDPNSFFSDSDP
jgi:hypothetical protein